MNAAAGATREPPGRAGGRAKVEAGQAQEEPAVDTREIGARLAIVFAGRYQVLRLIGIGGMASVYLVRHRIHHGLFAVKVLHPSLAGQHDFLARFRREGLLGARLAGHPNIAPVLDVGENDGLHYLVMPYIAGEDLDHLLARVGRFSVEDALLAIAQINDALLYAWSKGIIHCDLAPGNIRLNEFGQFILFDFGLAAVDLSPNPIPNPILTNPVSLPGSAAHIGTPLYMSPERILGQAVDIRSDLYALGAIFYELLTGEAAFCGRTLEEIKKKHLAPARPSSHPKLAACSNIQPVLESLLARSPGDRFANPAALKQALCGLMRCSPRPVVQPEIMPGLEIPAPRRRLSRL